MFEAINPPDVENGDWSTWKSLMGDRKNNLCDSENASMTIISSNGLETVSSSLMALPSQDNDAKPQWLFAPGRPDTNAYENVKI